MESHAPTFCLHDSFHAVSRWHKDFSLIWLVHWIIEGCYASVIMQAASLWFPFCSALIIYRSQLSEVVLIIKF